MKLIITISIMTYVIQLFLLSGLFFFKKSYLNKYFSKIKEEDLFVDYVEKLKSIEKKDLKETIIWSFVPIIGFLNIYLLYLIFADEISRYFNVSDDWEGIKMVNLFDGLSSEFKRLEHKDTKPIGFALTLVKNNDYKQIVLSASELLLKSLSVIKHNSNKETSNEIDKTIDDYMDLLKTIAETPEQLDISTLDNTRNIFKSVKNDLTSKKGIY